MIPTRRTGVRHLGAALFGASHGLSAGLIAVSLALCVASPRAFAEEPAPSAPDYDAAREHYQKAGAAQEAGRWEEAATHYQAAYEITKDPVLFFHLGNVQREQGKCNEAKDSYGKYLKLGSPSEEFVADTKKKMESCELAESGTDSQPADSSPLPTKDADDSASSSPTNALSPDELSEEPPLRIDSGKSSPSFLDEEDRWQQTAAWTSVAVTAGLLGTSAILGLSARSRQEDLENLIAFRDLRQQPTDYNATVRERHDRLVKEGEDLERYSLVALGFAGVSLTASIVFFVWDDHAKKEQEKQSGLRLRPHVAKGEFGLTSGWSF